MDYNPLDWYWLADDGRVFASARSVIVDKTDAGFKARDTADVTRWPVDDKGQQTNAALQAVLAPYGLFVDLASYAAAARYAKEVAGTTVSGMPVATDDRSKLLISGARQGADADPAFTTPFAVAGTVTTLDATQVIAISNAVLAHVQGCFLTYADVVKGIAAGTVKTVADVDAAFATVTA